MAYTYDTSYTSDPSNWMKGRNGNKVQGITIHHWGASKTLDFYGIVKFLCSKRPSNPTSAHYVIQGRTQANKPDRRVACIVDPDDTAYHAGNWQANLTEIGIECRPYPTDADYDVVAELVAKLWTVYGVVPLYPHRHWTSTECPGEYDVTRVKSLAESKYRALTTGSNPAPTPEKIMALTNDDIQNIWTSPTADLVPAPSWTDLKTNPNWLPTSFLHYTYEEVHQTRDNVLDLQNRLKDITTQLTALSGRLAAPSAAPVVTQADLETALRTVLGS